MHSSHIPAVPVWDSDAYTSGCGFPGVDLLNHGGLAAHGSLGLGSAAWQSFSGDDGEDNQSIMFVTSKRVPAGDQVGAETGGMREVLGVWSLPGIRWVQAGVICVSNQPVCALTND